MEVLQWMIDWGESPYAVHLRFIAFICLVLILRTSFITLGKARVKRRGLEDSDLFPFIKSMMNWSAFYAILIFMIVYLPDERWLAYSFQIGTTDSITVLSILVAVMIITFGFRISQFFTRFVLQPTLSRYDLDTGVQYTFSRISHYIIIIIAVLIGISNIGINLNALTVFASVIGIGIGFGLQNIASNFISGIILLFERPFKIGDVIKVEDILCVVEEVKMRATVVTTFDNERIIIPNSQMVENQIVNWSYGDERMRVIVPIGVAYGSDVQLLKSLLLQAAHEQEHVLPDPEPRVDFMAFGNSSLDFRVVAWVPSPRFRLLTLSNMNFRINQLLAENGIEIPFPQRDLHLRSVDPKIIDSLKKDAH